MLNKPAKSVHSDLQGAGCQKWIGAIDKMASLESGWLDGSGKPVDESIRKSVKNFILSCERIPEFYAVIPTEEGGILLEYKSNGWDYGIEFEPDQSATFFGVKIGGEGEFSDDFNAGDRDSLSKRITESLANGER